MKEKQIVGGYLVVQAAAVAGWWGVLFFVPGATAWFQPHGWSEQSLLGFWLADGLMLVGGSLMVAGVVWRSPAWASNAVWALAAACWYPALYCIGVSAMTGEAWLASSMMLTMAGLMLAMATVFGASHQQPAAFRAVRMNTGRALWWTFLQIVVFWGTFFWVLPRGVMEVEAGLGIARFAHRGQALGAGALFVVFGMLGLWSAVVMTRVGRSTPLPTATGSQLIVVGPYRWVRNPMAVAGILQGVAVGWFLGSISVMVYALAGAVLWHVAVRPAEEADMVKRFGEPYGEYRRSVGLWLPGLWHKTSGKGGKEQGLLNRSRSS